MVGGVQLISIGVLAQYIGMIFEQVKQRPLYTLRQVYNLERKS
jgi:dolichol-phosphate mannosyltransferase